MPAAKTPLPTPVNALKLNMIWKPSFRTKIHTDSVILRLRVTA
jgi:hypothetical protein